MHGSTPPPSSGTVARWQPPAGGATMPAPSVQPQVTGPLAELGRAATVQSGAPDQDYAGPLPAETIVGQRYRLERHISSGGFGAVYKAADTAIENHHVALKLLHSPADSEQARENALRELRLIASVAHPSVVQFKDYGWHEGRLWFAMPWYQGTTLDARLRDPETGGKVAMSRAEARPIFERVARGLAAMHDVGIGHHDIKPENIFLADVAGFDGGLPVLLDLGIAASSDEAPMGFTPEYAAPETASAALGEQTWPIAAKADVFALALTLRNALEPELGEEVEGDGVVPYLHRRATEQVELPRRKDLRYLHGEFSRWLNPEPDERPSAAEFAAELAKLTAPEERREARMRLLRRLIPFALLASAVVGALAFQLTAKQEELVEKEQALSDQVQETARLRQTSEQQLGKLEQSMTTIGAQQDQLKEAIAIARNLDQELDKVEESRGRVIRRLRSEQRQNRALTEERDKLQADLSTLQQKHEELLAHRDQLIAKRDELTKQRDQLIVKRDKLTSERDALAKERDALRAERDDLRAKREVLDAKVATLEDELQKVTAARDRIDEERAEARQKVEELTAERNRLRARVAELEKTRKGSPDESPRTPKTQKKQP